MDDLAGIEQQDELNGVGLDAEEDEDRSHELEDAAEGMSEDEQDEEQLRRAEEEEEQQQPHYDDDEEMDEAWGGGLGETGLTANLRAMAGYLSGAQSRFRGLLASLRSRKDPTAQLIALQELSELLSLSNEDTLAGYFPSESFIRELIYIMGGPKPPTPPGEASSEPAVEDEDAALAAALAAADSVDRGEMTLLACRCLANLIEALPYAAHSIVSYGAIPVLLSKLTEIEFIDLAEQTLQTLEKISFDLPSSIVRDGGLMAMLQYLDFFGIYIQRIALTAASHCCRKLSADQVGKVRDVLPIITNVLSYSDQRLVESACKCIVRIIDSYKHQGELLEGLLERDLIEALNALLLRGSPSTSTSSAGTTISVSTYTDLLKSMGTAVRAGPKVAVTLLESNIVETLYALLTGASAPEQDGSGGSGPASTSTVTPAAQLESSAHVAKAADLTAVAIVGQSGAGGEAVAVADMAVLQNLAHRPKEQVQEALSLISELLPPLSREGVFDPRNYSERAWHKKRKADRAARDKLKQRSGPASDVTMGEDFDPASPSSPSALLKVEHPKAEKDLLKEQAQKQRIEMLSERRGLVKRFTQLVLPTLVEVYAASVALHIRTKALQAMLKIISFVDAETLKAVLDEVPLASFVASILSSRDDPSLVLAALQAVEILCNKLPEVYKSLLRREGVMWEIEDIASKEPRATKQSQKASQVAKAVLPSGSSTAGLAAEIPTTVEVPPVPTVGDSAGLPTTTSVPTLVGAAATTGLGVRSTTSSPAKSSTTGLHDAEDANIWRARILRDNFAKQAANADNGADRAGRALDNVKRLVQSLEHSATAGQTEAAQALDAVTSLFSRSEEPISSFELLRSGLIDGLYKFATGETPQLPSAARRELLITALMTADAAGGHGRGGALVRRLQESLSRLENVDIAMALNSGTADDIRRNGVGGVHRQLHLRLQAEEGTEVPKGCSNLVVGIHAIASFERLAEFLRPKLSAGEGGASRLSSVLAALSGGAAGLESVFAAERAQRLAAASAATTGAGAPAASSSSSSPKKTGTASATGALPTADALSTESSSSKPLPPARRRSSRLSGKQTGEESVDEPIESTADDDNSGSVGKGKASEAQTSGEDPFESEAARKLMETLLAQGLDSEEYSDEEIGEEVFREELEDAEPTLGVIAPAEDKTVDLSVADDGKKIDVSTPNGTRVPTPSNAAAGGSAGRSKASSSPAKKPSYAAALQRKPSDWHIRFSMEGQELPLDSTIYAAVHRIESQKSVASNAGASPSSSATAAVTASSSRYIWSNVYTVKYKKVPGPASAAHLHQTPEPEPSSMTMTELPPSIPADSSFAKILQLLRVLHDLNSEWRETRRAKGLAATDKAVALDESAFVNNKLTAKLNRQLEELMIVASKCLPDWSLALPKRFSFLFPFEARYAFLQSTAFGYNRMLQRWQTQASRNSDAPSNHASARLDDSSLAHLVRLPRAKVRIARNNILPSAFRVMELYGKADTILEVEYFEEVGTGLGPTLEFYSLTSKEFASRYLQMWRDDNAHDSSSSYVYAPHGLFPAPISEAGLSTAAGKGRLAAFKILGQFVAKAVLDSRIIDCNFSPIFMRSVLNHRVAASMSTLQVVDATLAASLQKMLDLSSDDLDALGLDWTLPGNADFELASGGKDTVVNSDNVAEYVEEVINVIVKRGIQPFVRAFRAGFNQIFPVSAMTSFTADELVMLFGNTDEDWSEATLTAAIKPDHGYTSDSPPFKDLLSTMASFDLVERREFLQWLTGSPKLPIGGFSGLQPQLTVVKRPHEPPLKPDDYLASNMSCANFLKLPQYSGKEVMRRRLLTAIREGAGAFNLS